MLNHAPSNKLMIGKQESPYYQPITMIKTRSSSNLKPRGLSNSNNSSSRVTPTGSSQIKLKNISPSRLANISTVITPTEPKITIKKKNPKIHNSMGHSYIELKDSENFQSSLEDAYIIEVKLSDRLKIANTYRDGSDKHEKLLEVYKDIFNEVILKDKSFGRVLKKIKDFFEKVLTKVSADNTVKDLKIKLKDALTNIKNHNELIKVQEKKIEKLDKERSKLAKELQRSEEICTEIQKKLCRITNFDASEVPKDEQKWKAVLLENRTYLEAIRELKEELKEYRYKEKKLMQLLNLLKDKGYPVESVYENEVVKKKPKPLPHYSNSSVLSSKSEYENLVSGRALSPPKPEFIPSLNLKNVEPEPFTSSSESCSSSYSYESENF